MNKKKWNKTQVIRLIVQLFFLGIVTFAAVRHQMLGGGPKGVPPIDGICPFGGLEAIYKFLTSGQFIEKLDWSDFALLGGVVTLAIFLGRYFCGWICALGTMQELFGKLGFLIFKKKFIIPSKIDGVMRYLKYGVLVWALYFTWKTGTLFIRPYDPFAAYAHIPAGWSELWGTFAVGLIILIVSLVASMFVDRFFCKYACPLGAFLGILSKVSLFKIKREDNTCTHCNICNKSCPVNLDIAGKEKIDSAECIGCLECVISCPTGKETLKTTILGKKINPIVVAILGVVIYLGIVAVANITGYWHSEKSLEEIATTGGTLNPENIKGYMTLKDISETYKIDLERLYHKLGITMEQVPPETMVKKIGEKLGKSESEFEVDKVREAVGEIMGVSVVTEEKETKHEEEKEIENGKSEESVSEKPNPEDIRGTMTIKEVAETYNISQEEIYKIIGKSKEEIPETTQLREIKNIIPGFEAEKIREGVKNLTK